MEQLGASPECIPYVYAFPVQLNCDNFEKKSMAKLAKAQMTDEKSQWNIEAKDMAFVAFETLCNKAAPLQQITSNGLLVLVCIDFLSLESDWNGASDILVVTD